METRILRGAEILAQLGARLDELHRATDAPITARRTWLQTWIGCHPGHEPFAILVEEGERLEGAALLARREARWVTEFVALGNRLSDQVRFPVRSDAAARALVAGMSAHFLANERAWLLTVRHLPSDDPVAMQLAAELPCAERIVGDASPTLRFGPERTLRAHVSKNHHQQVRRMLNRLQGEGLEPRIEHLREPAAIAAILPRVIDVCLERDLELRGESLLDGSGHRRFFGEVIRAHAARGEVELTTLHVGEELAAYVLCFLDGPAYRMWNCRLAPAWSRYGVGRIANNAALEHALADPRANEFDWMRGPESYKLSMSNHVEYALDLRAWSNPTVRACFDSTRRLKHLVKHAVAEHTWLQPALDTTRRLKFAGRRRKRSIVDALKRGAR
jgi:CelD/BcsL family acetyltransferase involved in cellulose biosynthesis